MKMFYVQWKFSQLEHFRVTLIYSSHVFLHLCPKLQSFSLQQVNKGKTDHLQIIVLFIILLGKIMSCLHLFAWLERITQLILRQNWSATKTTLQQGHPIIRYYKLVCITIPTKYGYIREFPLLASLPQLQTNIKTNITPT